MQPDVIKAAPRSKVIFYRVATLVAVGSVLILNEVWFHPWLRRYLSVADPVLAAARGRHVLLVFVAFVGIVVFLAFFQAWRIFRAGQFPLPGAFVSRDTPVRRGPAAAMIAIFFILLGSALLWLSIRAVAFRMALHPPRGAAQVKHAP
jgi:hypothetical protein